RRGFNSCHPHPHAPVGGYGYHHPRDSTRRLLFHTPHETHIIHSAHHTLNQQHTYSTLACTPYTARGVKTLQKNNLRMCILSTRDSGKAPKRMPTEAMVYATGWFQENKQMRR